MPIAYRFEHPDENIGPYYAKGWKGREQLLEDHSNPDNKRPVINYYKFPECLEIPRAMWQENRHMLCSCPSLRKLRKWFNNGHFERIIAAGFLLKRYHVKAYYRQGLQGEFFRDEIISETIIKPRTKKNGIQRKV